MTKKTIIILLLLVFCPLKVGSVGHYPDCGAKYKIRFGWMKQNTDGSYYVYKETSKIPFKLKHTGFCWGYTIHSEYFNFSTYSIDYGPSTRQPVSLEKNKQEKENILVKMDSTYVNDGTYWRWTANEPDDPIGEQKIEVFINGKLYRTIHFTITKP